MALVRITLAHLALVALSAGASASPSLADAFTPVDVAALHGAREMIEAVDGRSFAVARRRYRGEFTTLNVQVTAAADHLIRHRH